MTMADADGGGEKQLLVGSDDFEVLAIRKTDCHGEKLRCKGLDQTLVSTI